MTIAERRAREEYDRKNPWLPIGEAQEDGSICELRVSHHGAAADMGAARFFLHEGKWYRIEPPKVVHRFEPLVEYRSTGFTIAKHRMRSVIARAEYGTYEYRGGRLYRKPRQYKLYWRADD
jgi:hypothetical protein